MTFPTQEHIDAARLAAARVMARTGFYCWPSVTLAQALIESAGWTKLSGKNNGFGIKATQTQIAEGKATKRTTREVINGKSVYIDAWFADYDSLADAYEAHAILFVRVGVYAPALKAKNAEAFIDIIAPHYATDPKYADDLKSICRKGGLYRYDGPGLPPPVKPPVATLPPDVPKPPPVAAPVALGWWSRLWGWFARAA